jgi:predicted DNA-binding protein
MTSGKHRLAKARISRMPTKGTQQRGIRVPPGIWLHALAITRRRGETISDVVREALESYIETHDPDGELGDSDADHDHD